METKKASADPIPLFIPQTYTSTEANKTGSWRYLKPRYEEKTAPCSAACPAGEDIGKIELLTRDGLFKEAWETILRENPFPAVCGRVCFHPCESQCNRGEFDEAIAIHQIERFLADTARKNEIQPVVMTGEERREEKIAIAGSGPSGLAAAWFLTRLGYRCEIFEAREEPGGILRWGIPAYRLPPDVLRSEIALIESLGVTIHTGRPLGPSFVEEARGRFAALFLGCGHGRSRSLGIPGRTWKAWRKGFPFSRRSGGVKPRKWTVPWPSSAAATRPWTWPGPWPASGVNPGSSTGGGGETCPPSKRKFSWPWRKGSKSGNSSPR